MYVWIWRRLPGGLPGKLIGSLVLLAAALALLFFVVFPFAEPRLPFNRVNVDTGEGIDVVPPGAATPTPATASPSATP